MEFRGIFVDLQWRRSGYSPNQLKRSKLQIHSLYVSLTPKTEVRHNRTLMRVYSLQGGESTLYKGWHPSLEHHPHKF